jgi:V8-like Glu-specific endopeptidase
MYHGAAPAPSPFEKSIHARVTRFALITGASFPGLHRDGGTSVQLKLNTLAMGAVAALAVALPSAAHATPQASAPATSKKASLITAGGARVAATPQRLAAYWTADRLADAKAQVTPQVIMKDKESGAPDGPAASVAGAVPADTAQASAATRRSVARAASAFGLEWTGSTSLAPATTTGKLFFRNLNGTPNNPADDSNAYCSASVVNTESKNVLFTAGHCVHGGKSKVFHTNLAFVPGYRNGARPRGTWFAREIWSFPAWRNDSNHRWDVASLVMRNNGLGQRLANVTGSQGIAWNQPAERYTYVFGYPGNKSSGERLNYCSATTYKEKILGIFWTGRLGINCDMTYGASGGPWVYGFNGQWGYLHSVTSTGDLNGHIFGPYFDTNVANLYQSVRFRY